MVDGGRGGGWGEEGGLRGTLWISLLHRWRGVIGGGDL